MGLEGVAVVKVDGEELEVGESTGLYIIRGKLHKWYLKSRIWGVEIGPALRITSR